MRVRHHDRQWHLDRMRETARARLEYANMKARPQMREVDGWPKDKRRACHQIGYARAAQQPSLSELAYLDEE